MKVTDIIHAFKMLSEAKEAALISGDFLIEFPELKAIYIKAIEEGECKCKKYLNKAMHWEN